ncbi:hypothetical protein W02_31300 [Nitrospira sp. KM1]|uniref:hypothetical protein n=1 Tax=Nitrospira sp. KM1 TaxID=1936990 RepID=UPI0013A772A6|nr:hypothetical protein [Nitrospira sp. KM1]BCA55990.1 hypothetical protein W02_31300 [Nitrospira sp. KM1]
MRQHDTWEDEVAYRRTLFQAALLGDQQAQLELEREFHARISNGLADESKKREATPHA